MSQLKGSPTTGTNWITHGSIHVLAYLHETDAVCSEVAEETGLAESSAYKWLTELDEAGILDSEPLRPEKGRPIVSYHLGDDELGKAASLLVDRLVVIGADTRADSGTDTRADSGTDTRADSGGESSADAGADD